MKKAYLIIPLVVSILLVIIPAASFSSNQIITVTSDSMSPALNVDDQLLVNQVDITEIREGDIVAIDIHFHDVPIITHRVVEVSEKNGETEIYTKGDHNAQRDDWAITQDSLVGLVVEINPPLLGLVADSVRYPLIAIAIISAILLGREFVKKKSLEIEQLYCFRCNNRWYPRIIDGKIKIPDTCPNKDCRSPYWRTPRKKR